MTTPEPGFDRRDLLVGAGAAFGAAAATFWFAGLGDPLRRARIQPTEAAGAARSLTGPQWATLAAAADRLLPSGGPEDPGARDVNAIGYLDALFATDEVEDETKTIVGRGAGTLDAVAQRQGAASFSGLSPDAQDAALREWERTPEGRKWLESILPFVLEAFLGDPLHGGNVGMVGWRWAHHTPGKPRPKRRA